MHESKCHRCGARAPRGPTARNLCARCAARTSDRVSAMELDSLRRAAGSEPDERISLELIGSIVPSLGAPLLPERRRWSPAWPLAIAVLISAVSIGGSGAMLLHATAMRADAPPSMTLDSTKATNGSVPLPLPLPLPADSEPATEPDSATESESESESASISASDPVSASARPRPSAAPVPRDPTPTPVVRPEPRPALPTLPSRSGVRDAFLAIHDGVHACGDIELIGTTVVARVVFRGDTGRVRHSQVTDATVPPEVRSCVARVAREARLAPFAQEQFTVRYPFRL